MTFENNDIIQENFSNNTMEHIENLIQSHASESQPLKHVQLTLSDSPLPTLKGRASLLKKREQGTLQDNADNTFENEFDTVKCRKKSRIVIHDSDDDEPINQTEDSILDVQDRLDEILEMNEAMAQIIKRKDPLFEEEEDQNHEISIASDANQDKLNLFNQGEKHEDDALYDSDGNPLNDDNYYEEDEESTHELDTDQIIERRNARLVNECDIELPMKKSAFNMNSFLSCRGITRNGLTFQMQTESIKTEDTSTSISPSKSKVSLIEKKIPLKIDKIIDPHRKTIQILSSTVKNEASSDSDDILEIVDYKIQPNARVKPSKQFDLLQIVQEQAKIRRKQDEEYKNYLIETQKKKKMARKAAKEGNPLENELPLKESLKNEITSKSNQELDLGEIIGEDTLSLNDSSHNNNNNHNIIKQEEKEEEDCEPPSSQLVMRSNDVPMNEVTDLLDLPSTQSAISDEESENASISDLEEEDDDEDLVEDEDEDQVDQEKQIQSVNILVNSSKNSQDVLDYLSGSFGSLEKSNNLLESNDDLLGMLSGQFSIESNDATTVIRDSLTPIPEVSEELENKQDTTLFQDMEMDSLDQKKANPFINPISPLKIAIFPPTTMQVKEPNPIKTIFVEEEAEVEDDEFMNMGGLDGEDDAALDRYDPEFVAEADKEVIDDFTDIMELHRKQMQLKHETEVSKLIKDVTSGNLRKRAMGKDGSGKGFDIESEEDDEELLRKIRNKHVSALVLDDIDEDDKTPLEKLASNPATASFAKCFVDETEDRFGFISSSEVEDELESPKWKNKKKRFSNSDSTSNDEDVEEEEEEEEERIHYVKRFSKKSRFAIQNLEEDDDEEEHDIVNQYTNSYSQDKEYQFNEQGNEEQGNNLSSEIQGVNVFAMITKRMQERSNRGIRVQESSRIFHKESFLSLGTRKTREYEKENETMLKKTNTAFQIGEKKGVATSTLQQKQPVKEKEKKSKSKKPPTQLLELLLRKPSSSFG